MALLSVGQRVRGLQRKRNVLRNVLDSVLIGGLIGAAGQPHCKKG